MSAALDLPLVTGDGWVPEGWFLPAPLERLPQGATDAAMSVIFAQESEYRTDPVGWIEERLGEHVWSKQADVANSVVEHRYTAVQSAHSTGKSWLAARLACWWLDVHPVGDAFVITSAPTQTQVETILWREIERAHRKAGLMGRITRGAVPMWKTDDGEIVAFGRKPATKAEPEEAMQAFQGTHATYVLVILDEGGGVPKWLYDAADSLSTNIFCRVLTIGNPDNPASHFEKVCRPGSGWNNIRISALDTPNFTGEWVPEALRHLLVSKTWVRERIKRWGKHSPIFWSKVLGRFPRVGIDTLISPALIENAQRRELPGLIAGRYGMDVADMGDDETVIYHNRAGVCRLARMPVTGEPCRWQGINTMQSAGKMARILRADRGEAGAVIDSIGVGAGVFARLRELELPVAPFKAGNSARRKDKYVNRRSEQWWHVREMFEAGLIDLDPEDDDLASQLGAIKWGTDSAGRTFIEPKKEMKKRLGGGSPDRADAFMHSTVNWDPLPPVENRGGEHDPPPIELQEISAGIMEAEL